jgi:hypothetical protein
MTNRHQTYLQQFYHFITDKQTAGRILSIPPLHACLSHTEKVQIDVHSRLRYGAPKQQHRNVLL